MGDGCADGRIDGSADFEDVAVEPDARPRAEDAVVADVAVPDGAVVIDGAPPADAAVTDGAAPADAAPEHAAPGRDAAMMGACEPGASRECVGGVGRCRPGLQVCTPGAEWGACRGAVEPAGEVCNGFDDDCDGLVDEVPVFQGEPQRVPAAAQLGRSQRLSWGGGGFALAWDQPDDGVYLAHMAEGRLGAPRRPNADDGYLRARPSRSPGRSRTPARTPWDCGSPTAPSAVREGASAGGAGLRETPRLGTRPASGLQSAGMDVEWEDVRHLEAVERAGSVKAAARALAVSASTVYRRIAALEAATSQPCIVRGAGEVMLTDLGAAVARVGRQTRAGLAEAIGAARALDPTLSGEVSLTTVEALLPFVLQPIAEVTAAHPLRVVLHLGDEGPSVHDREVDLAISVVRRPPPGCWGRRLCRLPYGVFGTPEAIARLPAPRWVVRATAEQSSAESPGSASTSPGSRRAPGSAPSWRWSRPASGWASCPACSPSGTRGSSRSRSTGRRSKGWSAPSGCWDTPTSATTRASPP